jgi:hypothetical protein
MAERIPQSADPDKRLPDLLNRLRSCLQGGRSEKARECAAEMAALSLGLAAREYRQMGRALAPAELSALLQNSFRPHQNRGKIQSRAGELTQRLQTALALRQTSGLRGPEQKQKQADVWMELALGCAKMIISAQAEELKLTQGTGGSGNCDGVRRSQIQMCRS